RALGAPDERRDPGRSATQGRLPVHGTWPERLAPDGRALHLTARASPSRSGLSARGRRRPLRPFVEIRTCPGGGSGSFSASARPWLVPNRAPPSRPPRL